MHRKVSVLFIGVAVLCALSIILIACARTAQPEGGTVTPPSDDTAPAIGKVAPDFTLPTMTGETVTLSQYRGKPVILIFWVVHCEGCIEEIPYIQEFYDKHADKVVVLTVHVGDARAQIQRLLSTRRITYPILIDADELVCINYRRGVPATFFIDREGVIREIKDDVFSSTKEIETMVQVIK